MSKISQIEALQQQLKKFASELGECNLKNNEYQEANQLLAKSILEIKNKINKKKLRIEQETKDKQILHQKLIKAENIKQQLEIKFIDKNVEPNQNVEMQPIQNSHQKQSYIPDQIHVAESKNKNQKIEEKEVQKQKKINITQMKKENQKSFVVQQSEQLKNYYKNEQKGQYKPPELFFDNQNEQIQSDDEAEDEKAMQALRQKLKQNDDDDDEDDEQ